MKKTVLSLFTIATLWSCNTDGDNTININERNFLIFGHYYGECFGEECVETFKLTDKSLFEDTIDDLNGESMAFVALEHGMFEQVKDITDFFPDGLLSQNETQFGCPDCGDGGGVFLRYSENGNVRTWRIDQVKGNIPEYLREFVTIVNEKIALINS